MKRLVSLADINLERVEKYHTKQEISGRDRLLFIPSALGYW